MKKRGFCVSIDVERDYRLDNQLTVRGIVEGLPSFLELLKSHGVPFDLMISGEVIEWLPESVVANLDADTCIGCHGLHHAPGYLNRLPTQALLDELRYATARIERVLGRRPRFFRAPNFSADGRTIRELESLGYVGDSSVLPGRYVRKWKVIRLIDHRGVGESPYVADRDDFPAEGVSTILEVPVAPNRVVPGGPLGLGFLHSHGPDAVLQGLSRLEGPYAVFLAHSWEMVSWHQDDPVAAWVPRASTANRVPMERLLAGLENWEKVNLERIAAREREVN